MEKEMKFNIRKLSPREQEELRKKIVREMEKCGGNKKEVEEICECSKRHVEKTWKKYRERGIAAIAAVKKGRPKGKSCKLNPSQEEANKKQITEKTREEAGLSGYLWGRAEVSELVKRQYGIEMPVTTMGDYLARWKFTYQRPKKKITGKTKKQ
jgi:transposase